MNSNCNRLHYQHWWRAGGAVLVLSVIVLSLMRNAPEIPINEGDKLGHLLAYGSLMFWFAQIDTQPRQRLHWALVFIAMGIALEFAQGMIAYRSFDGFDMLADTAGVLLGWLAAPPRGWPVFRHIESLMRE
jgi:VanZ family protein